MSLLLCLAPLLPPAADVLAEERLLATVPEGLELEGEPFVGPDGKQYPNVNPVHWSPDGTQVAYVGMRDGASVPVVGERAFDAFQFVNGPVFGPTGAHVAFTAGNRTKSDKAEEWVLLSATGEELAEDDWFGAPRFSPDGSRLAVWSHPGVKIGREGFYTGGSMVLLVGEEARGKWKFKKGKKHDGALDFVPPVFSADGETCAVVVQDGTQWSATAFRGSKEKAFDKQEFPYVADFALAPDGDAVALCVPDSDASAMPAGMPAGMTMPGARNHLVFGKSRWGTEYESVGAPTFSADGEHLAYKVLRSGKLGIAADGRGDAPTRWDVVSTPVFSPDGKRLAYVGNVGAELPAFVALSSWGASNARGGRWTLVAERTDGKGDVEELARDLLELHDPTWSPDGERLAYRARTEEGWFVACGDAKSPVYDEVGAPHFTADGKALGFGARSGRELWWRVLALEE